MKISWNEKQECVVETETPEEEEKFQKMLVKLDKDFEDWDDYSVPYEHELEK